MASHTSSLRRAIVSFACKSEEIKLKLTLPQKIAISAAIIATCLLVQSLLSLKWGLWGFDVIIAGCLISGAFLGRFYAVGVPLAICVGYYSLSQLGPLKYPFLDLLKIYAFVWSAYILCGVIGRFLKNRLRFSLKFVGELTGVGLVCAIIWGLIVDTGWWWILYPHTLDRLGMVLAFGLPYTLRRMFSQLILIPSLAIPLLVLFKRLAIKVPVKVPVPVLVVARARRKSKSRRVY
jgi:hypothetical protein